MKKEMKATHIISYQMKGGCAHEQKCYGKTDLFNCLREMMKDGYTTFTIKTI